MLRSDNRAGAQIAGVDNADPPALDADGRKRNICSRRGRHISGEEEEARDHCSGKLARTTSTREHVGERSRLGAGTHSGKSRIVINRLETS